LFLILAPGLGGKRKTASNERAGEKKKKGEKENVVGPL